MARKIELLNDSQQVVHPLTSADCVVMENGETLDKVMGDGIATPTVTHEGTSFQVGVGDSNIEVVDGDVAGMTLEGQTYQNILPKPTTLIMETDEKEFKINDKIDSSIVLDDNVAEIATIKGQTYVNAVQEESASEYVAIGEELSGQSITTTGKPEGIIKGASLEGMTKYHDIDNDVILDEFDETKNLELISVKSPNLLATGKNLFDGELELGGLGTTNGLPITTQDDRWRTKNYIKVKPSTTYVAYNNYSSTIGIREFDDNYNFISWSSLPSSNRFTTSNNTKYLKFVVINTNNDNLLQIEEGSTATSYEPYKGITIEQSIDSIPLTSNMFEQNGYSFNSTSLIRGMSLQQIPLFNSDTRIKTKTLIKLKPNSTYTINADMSFSYACFNKDGNYLKAFDFCSTFTTDSETHYIVMNLRYEDNSNITPSTLDSLNLTLQEVTDEIVLRSIGDVKDTLNLTTGEYVQRIGEVVLDGSERWQKYRAMSDGTYNFVTNKIDKTAMNDGAIISDILPIRKDYNKGIGLFMNRDNSKLELSFNDLSTVEEVINYLNNNNATVQYELATPIIHKVNLTNTTKLPSYNSTTHYDTIVPSNSLIPNIKLPSTIDYNVAIKPSTQYTVRCNTTSAMSVNLGGSTGTLVNGKVTLTTPSTLAHNSLKLGSSGKAKEVMVIEGNEIKDNVPFFNGMKNVQMGGIKLVNIARGAVCNNLVTANTNKTQFIFNGNGSNWGVVTFDKSLLKANTTYTVYLNVVSVPSDSNGGKFQFGDGDNKWFQIDAKIGIVKGLYTTTESELSWNGGFDLRIRPFTLGEQIIIENPMIIEGDWTHLDEIPFIESEMIIEQPIIRSQGKNLFNINIKENVVNWNGANIKSNSDNTITFTPNSDNSAGLNGTFKFVKPIRFKVGTQFTYTFNRVSGGNSDFQGAINARLRVNKKDGSQETLFIGDLTSSYFDKVISKTYTFTEDFDSIVSIEPIMYSVRNLTSPITIRYQLEEGSSATTYEPFKQHTLSSNRVIGYEEGYYYHYGTGNKETNEIVNSMLADVEGLSIAYVTGGSSNYTFWDKDNVFISGKRYLDTSLSSYDKNGFIAVPSNAKYMRFAAGIETNYKITTVTGELPLRSLPNGVCDSFNLVTGEYVQRVGEVVLDGSHPCRNDTTNGTLIRFNMFGINSMIKVRSSLKCDKLPVLTDTTNNQECIHNGGSDNYKLMLWIDGSHLSTQDASGLNKYLSQNPITVQYELATPIVRKIGLTAKGNYKEIELNGSEEVRQNPQISKKFHVYRLNLANDGQSYTLFTNNERFKVENSYNDYTIYKYKDGSELVLVINSDINSIALFKQWLSQNPLKIGHLTNNSAMLYSNILKPIFFNNVNVQFMNNNIEIQPSLTLQARSRNSYVMDMMKPNTKYTLKALKNSNSFTIDGTSYNATTNGTFTSPSALTNKLMITGQDVYELMIIEGDVTGLTIPYYKGIRSAYDNTDEIEIYSANKNLLPKEFNNRCFGENIKQIARVCSKMIECKPNATYTVYNIPSDINTDVYVEYTNDYAEFGETVTTSRTTIGSQGKRSKITFTTPIGYKYMAIYIYSGSGFSEDGYNYTNVEISLCLGTLDDYTYQQHQHNTTSFTMPTRLETVDVVRPIMEIGRISEVNGQEDNTDTGSRYSKDYIPVEPNMILTFMNGNAYRAENIRLYGINKNYISAMYTNGSGDLIIPKDCYFIRFYSGASNTNDMSVIKKQYKTIALNSLPNGIKDEIVIEPVSNKTKLIQRVGKVVLDGSESWVLNAYHKNTTQFIAHNIIKAKNATRQEVVCDKLQSVTDFYTIVNDSVWIYSSSKLVIHHSSSTSKQLKDWLKQNPITVYYELAEPSITEIRLKGYPFVYEDGSITLNTDIAPVTRTSYNVNQHQLINSQNETIIRHDKQISDLYDYIEIYLDEIYRMELFKMQLELSL